MSESQNEVSVDDKHLLCIGCGSQIQTSKPKVLGYTPQSILKKGLKYDELYCQRCFRLRHYNEIMPSRLTDKDFRQLLTKIKDFDALIVYVVDIFDFNGSIISGLHKFVGNNPILLVGNKEDLLPRSLKRSKLRDWLRQRANEQGLNPLDVILVSAKMNHSIEKLLNFIKKYQEYRDIYIVGVTNVGKSTLINQIIHHTTNQKDVITTSRFPGTTLDLIHISLENGYSLVDTPGIIHNSQMAHFLSGKDLKIVTPQKQIKPKTYQLNSNQTIFLGGVARFDYVSGGNNGFTIYVDNMLPLHRTKMSNADDFYVTHLGGLLSPPSNGIDAITKMVSSEFNVMEKSDLVFEGLGWITIPAGTIVRGYSFEGVGVLIRKAMI